MRAKNQEIVMPEKSRAMTQEEMEYEGGFFGIAFGIVSTICDFAVSSGIVKGDRAKALTAISYGCTVVGAVTSFGGSVALAAGAKTVAKVLIRNTTSEAKAAGGTLASSTLVAYQTGIVSSRTKDYGAGSTVGLAISLL